MQNQSKYLCSGFLYIKSMCISMADLSCKQENLSFAIYGLSFILQLVDAFHIFSILS